MQSDAYTDPAIIRALYTSRGKNRALAIKRSETLGAASSPANTQSVGGITGSGVPGGMQGGTVLDIKEIGRPQVDDLEIE